MNQVDHLAKAIGFAWAITFARLPIFKIVSFLEYLVFFRTVFCTEQIYCSCTMVFGMFLAFLIFDPNWPFCKGYSLCMGYSLCKMADFQNRLISLIFGVFSNGFLHRKTLMFFWNGFWHVFGIFESNWSSSCKQYSLCKMGDFQNCLISRIFGVFSKGFLHRTNLMFLYNGFWHFFGIFNFWPKLTILQSL